MMDSWRGEPFEVWFSIPFSANRRMRRAVEGLGSRRRMKGNGTPVPGNMAPWLGLRCLGGEPLGLCRYINGFLRGRTLWCMEVYGI